MSLREEDRQKNNCPSRGLGLAAAAIGVGVGAALYYFFSKRPENPDSEGSTHAWHEEPQTLSFEELSDDSFTTISEHSTTDTSMDISDNENNHLSDFSESSFNNSDIFLEESIMSISSSMSLEGTFEVNMQSPLNVESSHESSGDWDVTTSIEIPSDRRELMRSPSFLPLTRLNIGQFQQRQTCDADLRAQAFRERTLTLEECSICFDVILKDQDVMALPCTHQFHTGCILPWLQEQQTCPNCRKPVD